MVRRVLLTVHTRTGGNTTVLGVKSVPIAPAAAVVEWHTAVLRIAEGPRGMLLRAIACLLRLIAVRCSCSVSQKY